MYVDRLRLTTVYVYGTDLGSRPSQLVPGSPRTEKPIRGFTRATQFVYSAISAQNLGSFTCIGSQAAGARRDSRARTGQIAQSYTYP